MTIQELNSFPQDIEHLSPIESDSKAIDLLKFVEESVLDIKDYKYLHFYSQFNGLIDSENLLKEEFKNPLVTEDNIEVLNEVTKTVTKPDTSGKKSKRERIIKLVLECLSIADRTGLNMNKYKKFYEGLSDEEFAKHMKSFTTDEDKQFYLEILPNKSEPPIEDIEKLLAKLKIPKEEYVYYKDDGYKDDPIRSREECSVGYVNVRRLQQILSKKNTYSLDIESRSSKTGQVTGADKIARISDSELYALTVFKADKAIQEFYGPRADSMISKTDMYGKISKYGYVYLDELASATGKNQTLNTINIYLLGAGINSDLVEKEEKTAKEQLTQAVLDAELLKMGGSIRKEDTGLENLNEHIILGKRPLGIPSANGQLAMFDLADEHPSKDSFIPEKSSYSYAPSVDQTTWDEVRGNPLVGTRTLPENVDPHMDVKKLKPQEPNEEVDAYEALSEGNLGQELEERKARKEVNARFEDVAAAAVPEINSPVLQTAMPALTKTDGPEAPPVIKSDVARQVYVAVNDKEKKDGHISYKLTKDFNGKYANLTLEGLEDYLKINEVTEYNHYAKILVTEDELLVYNEANDIGILKLPFTRKIENCKLLNRKTNK